MNGSMCFLLKTADLDPDSHVIVFEGCISFTNSHRLETSSVKELELPWNPPIAGVLKHRMVDVVAEKIWDRDFC